MTYREETITRNEADTLPGVSLLDFGTNWCGYCQAAAPIILQAVTDGAVARHIKIEDGKGRRLGRSYGVKRWPTLIVLSDGTEVARLVRPTQVAEITMALDTGSREHQAGTGQPPPVASS